MSRDRERSAWNMSSSEAQDLVFVDFLAIWCHSYDDTVLITVRRHHVTVAVFCDFPGANFWINKFQADEIAGVKPGLDRLRPLALDFVERKLRAVVRTLAMVGYSH